MIWTLNPELLKYLKIEKEDNGKHIIWTNYFPKKRSANPEEIVRQLMLVKLVLHYNYDPQNIILEYPIQIGSTKKRADIVILKDGVPYIICETKSDSMSYSKDQLSSYLAVTRTKYGVTATGIDIILYQQNDDGSMSVINDIPISYDNSISPRVKESIPVQNFEENKTYGITKLVRNGVNESIITINEEGFIVKNTDLMKYQNLKNILLQEGVLLSHSPTKKEWEKSLAFLFKNAEKPPVNQDRKIINNDNDDDEIMGLEDGRELMTFAMIKAKLDFTRDDNSSNKKLSYMLRNKYVKYPKRIYIKRVKHSVWILDNKNFWLSADVEKVKAYLSESGQTTKAV
jgi:hypothetical protein